MALPKVREALQQKAKSRLPKPSEVLRKEVEKEKGLPDYIKRMQAAGITPTINSGDIISELSRTSKNSSQMSDYDTGKRLIDTGLAVRPGAEPKAGNFLNRAQRSAQDIMMLLNPEVQRLASPQTGSKVADVGADILGTLLGFVANPAGAINPARTALQLGSQGGQMAAAKTTQKLSPAVAKQAGRFIEGAGAGAAYGGAKAFSENKGPIDIAKEAGKEAALFGALDVGGRAVAESVIAPLWKRAFGNIQKGTLEKVATEQVAEQASATTQKATRPGYGKLTPKNTELEKSVSEYNQAVERVQNYFQTNELRTDEMARVKSELGIDFDRIIARMEKAEKGVNLKELGDRGRMEMVVGARDVPKLSRTGAKEIRPQNIKPKATVQEPVPTQPIRQAEATATAEAVKPVEGKVRGTVRTMLKSEKPPGEFKEQLTADSRSTYKPITNAETVAKANERVKNIDSAYSFVMSAEKSTADHVATGFRLIDELNKAGQIEKAVDVAEKIAQMGTKSGQTTQSFSIYNRLSAEGILVHAQRVAQRVNDKLPIGARPAKVTPEMAAQLTDLATTMQKARSVKGSANTVIDIVSKAKEGGKLTVEETAQVKQFISEASKFVGKLKPFKPKPPVEIKNPRVRDNVIDFFSAQEAKALERIKARRAQVSAFPLDEFADYTIIGASKLAKGTVKFADWSEAMVKDLGEEIRPVLEKVYDKAVETFNTQSKKIKPRELSDVEKIVEKVLKNKQIGEEEAAQFRQLASKISELSGETKNMASQDLQFVLQTLERPTLGQKVATAQTIAQLLNTKTFVRNILGNESMYRLERAMKLVATPIDIGISKITGERSYTFKKAQGQYWSDWLKGWQAGMKGVNPEGLTTQYDIRGSSFSSKWNPLTYLERVMGASLKSFDYASYKRAVNNTLNEMGYTDSINKGLTGEAAKRNAEQFIRNADENILQIAEQYGQYVTFQDLNIVSKTAVKIKRGLNLGKDFGAGDIIIKYPRTPANLLLRALEYSPAGFLRSVKILTDTKMFGKAFNQRNFVESLSRAIIGTAGLTGLGAFLADKDVITGSGNADSDIRNLEQMAGQGQYRVNVGAVKRFVASGFDPKTTTPQKGDLYISYDWLQPLAVSLALGVNFVLASEEEEKTKGAKSTKAAPAFKAIRGAVQTIVEQSFLRGLESFIDKPPGAGWLDQVVKSAQDIPSSFIPTIVNQVKQMTDNIRRSTYNPDLIIESLNKVKNKTPGLSKTLPIQYNTLGEPIQTFQDDSNSILNVFFNPSFVSRYNPSEEAKLVIDVIRNTGNEQVAPRTQSKSLTVDGERYRLTPEQWSKMQKLVGEETSKRIGRINPNKSDEKKIKDILEALNEAGEKARKQMRKEVREP